VRLTHADRATALDGLESTQFDLVVIGGGITGAGVARDAALRGLSVALIESDDFAAGTSSRSSKLIHGGLRYLPMGDVGLVRETALERKAVHAMAPHLAEPCWLVVPTRGHRSSLKFRAAIGTYEKLGAVEAQDRHQNWDDDELAGSEPILRQDRFDGAVVYREYLTDDARLVLAVLRSAVAAGAQVFNRLPAVDLVIEGGPGNAASAAERESGDVSSSGSTSSDASSDEGDAGDGAPPAAVTAVVARCGLTGREVTLDAKVVVNAAGPWVEKITALENADAPDRMHLSKGVHVVISADRLPATRMVIMTTNDKRNIFAIPKGRSVYIGTTDTSYLGDRPLWPEITTEDVDYLLEAANAYFDVEPLGRSDVIAAWAGVRPLIAEEGKEARDMSRKDELWDGPAGMITIAGGKLTGFRKMAIDVVEKVEERLGREKSDAPEPEPLPGGDMNGDLTALAYEVVTTIGHPAVGLGAEVLDRLVRLYGTETHDVLGLGPDRIVPDGQVVVGEVRWAVETEAAHTLVDVLYRRTRAAWFCPHERDALVEPVARLMADLLDWDDVRVAAEIEAVTARYAQELELLGEEVSP